MSSKRTVRLVGIAVLVAILFGAGVLVGGAMSAFAERADGKLDSRLLSEVQNALNEKFVFWNASSTLPTDKEIEYGMIKGYVDAYSDPYTVFFPPQEAKSFAENVQGSFGGVGMHVGMKDSNIIVIAPLKDSPAMKAGIKAGDIITAVDGKSVVGYSSDEAVSMIRGEVGKNVTITVIHPDVKAPVDITIKREIIKIPTLDTQVKDGVFVIQLYNFSAESPEIFRKALNDFIVSGLRHLVIDLRGNPGGYLDAAVAMTSYFLPEGKVIVSEKIGQTEETYNHRSLGYTGVPNGVKVVVLVDNGSASASEILAGALKDHGVAKVVGEKTFGKGSVQELVNLSDGSSLKVTIAKWFTPDGINISVHGIKPDVLAPAATGTPKLGDDGKPVDIQLEKAIQTVKAMR